MQLAGTPSGLSTTKIGLFLGVAVLLIGGAIAGYMFIKKKKQTPHESAITMEETSSQGGRPSATISLGGMAQDDETQSIQSYH